MKKDYIRTEWKNFKFEYKQYFLTNDEEWLLLPPYALTPLSLHMAVL